MHTASREFFIFLRESLSGAMSAEALSFRGGFKGVRAFLDISNTYKYEGMRQRMLAAKMVR